jgi:NDP-sugar pyrophosphorylase family protein
MSSNSTNLDFVNSLYELLKEGEYKAKLAELKEILNEMKKNLTGLTINDYKGDYPTFIEPVYLYPDIKIGDTVLIGPKVFIDEGCKLGNFTEISNVILCKNVVTEKLVKLNHCIVDKDVLLPKEYNANNAFITKNEAGELKKYKFP